MIYPDSGFILLRYDDQLFVQAASKSMLILINIFPYNRWKLLETAE